MTNLIRPGQVWSYFGNSDYEITQVYQKTNLAGLPVEMVLLRSLRSGVVASYPYPAARLQELHWTLKHDVSIDLVEDVLVEILGL